jgi:hypothetical protein
MDLHYSKAFSILSFSLHVKKKKKQLPLQKHYVLEFLDTIFFHSCLKAGKSYGISLGAQN